MVELRAFMGLADLFRERNWPSPLEVDIRGEMTGTELLAMLDIPQAKVEVVFVNGRAFASHMAVLTGGDRVALVPPGVPGPHRVMLGFKKLD
jgi:sulfur carrier protein ThiS